MNDCQRIILHAAMPEVTEVHAGIFFSVKDEAGQTVRSEQLPSGSDVLCRVK